mmetsp:Transcript_5460/g.7382  ORF Transcript_5460/g.7382 Transcript_5460/m.7382 type:complete len:130 (+) Transcript_5460:23-412(+)|eukprot:CAMPEP_0196591188 /NCGR_PEP_ID=MMETSP1081-20130531/68789_1 /TAXON_ID=36882 /ORGANISM="Pyramimonas amylifera, Strain CCMP720" /LENGTH=129 /DNA_ID=CAMNT_0041914481 /DNA_START=23 /DNA_END=412 /DNA_ORIENTATION=-
MFLSGISHGVHVRVEKFNRETTLKFENLSSDRASVASLKGTSISAAERCEKLQPGMGVVVEELRALDIPALKASVNSLTLGFQTTREHISKEFHEDESAQTVKFDKHLVDQKIRHSKECTAHHLPGADY